MKEFVMIYIYLTAENVECKEIESYPSDLIESKPIGGSIFFKLLTL